jgi:hypothetical protein
MHSVTGLVHLLVFKYLKKCKTCVKKFVECKMCVSYFSVTFAQNIFAVIHRCMQECMSVLSVKYLLLSDYNQEIVLTNL